MYPNAGGATVGTQILAIDYATLRSNIFSASLLSGIDEFTVQPATTFSTSESTLFAPSHVRSSSASYRLNTITGTPSAPIYTQGTLKINPLGGWSIPGGNILPQTYTGTCP